MKIEITKAQLKSIKSMADDMSAMIGVADNDSIWKRHVKNIDTMLKKNNLPKRDFK